MRSLFVYAIKIDYRGKAIFVGLKIYFPLRISCFEKNMLDGIMMI